MLCICTAKKLVQSQSKAGFSYLPLVPEEVFAFFRIKCRLLKLENTFPNFIDLKPVLSWTFLYIFPKNIKYRIFSICIHPDFLIRNITNQILRIF